MEPTIAEKLTRANAASVPENNSTKPIAHHKSQRLAGGMSRSKRRRG
jgi:hypothetical protein